MAGWGYAERAAPPGLGLEVLWRHTVPPDGEPIVQPVLPDARMDLIWFAHAGRLVVAGPDTGPRPATLPPGARVAAVRFAPGRAHAALGVPADAVRDGRPDLADLWGTAAAEQLSTRLANAPDPHTVLVHAVRDRLRGAADHGSPGPPGPPGRADRADPLVAEVVRHARAGQSVSAIAGRLGLSDRQLRRRSLTAFGYGPKTLVRILRFQRALTLARQGVPPAHVAAGTGYSDQAHLYHDVRALAGMPLSRLL